MNPFRNFKLNFDRSFSKGIARQVVWLLCIMTGIYIALIGLSYLSYFYVSGSGNSYGRWYDVLFLLFDAGTISEAMKSPFAVICAVFGMIVFNGMLISVISNVLERRVERFAKGETDYDLKNHVVVLGTDRSLPSLLRHIHQQHPSSYIAVMSQRDCEEMRVWLHSNIAPQIEKYVILMNGVRYADDDLQRLCLHRNVKEVYVLGEEDEIAHDANNMECVKRLVRTLQAFSKNAPREQSKLKCHILLESQVMFKVLQSVNVDEDINSTIDFLPFNFNEIWAQKVLATIPSASVIINGEEQSWTYLPLDDKGITVDSKKHVHLVIFGMTKMGITLATNAAHVLHYPNHQDGDFNHYSRITFIDSHAHDEGKIFRRHFHHLFELARWRTVGQDTAIESADWNDPMSSKDNDVPFDGLLGNVNFMDIEWEFVEAEIEDDAVMNYLQDCATNPDEILSIAFCFDQSEENTNCATALTEPILENAHQILVRQNESPFVINMLMRRPGYEKLRPFGIVSECYHGDIIHENYGKLVNACYSGIDLNDTSAIDKAWDKLSVALKWSNIYCANMLYAKLRFLGLDTSKELKKEDIDAAIQAHASALQRTEHNRWNTEKLLMGYRPLQSEEERKEWKKDKASSKAMKQRMLHLDILSNDLLKQLDPDTVVYDINVNKMLAELYIIATKQKNMQ